MRWKVAILTASDRGFRGEREDTSAQVIRELVEEEMNGEIVEYRVVPDEKDEIMAALIEMTDYYEASLILTTGGTGLAARDVTPEATLGVVDRLAPGFAEAMRAGAMAKTGAYGFIRFCIPLFPSAAQSIAPIINILAIIGILYCALMALVQTDLKRLVAYSSISHLGVIMLGLFAFSRQGVIGSVLQMVNHGITIAALFIIAGLIEERTGTRRLSDFGGLAKKMPVLATLTVIASLSSLGLPGLNSFAGEFLALFGAFQGNAVFGVLGTLVIIPAAWYMLRFFQGVMHGPLQNEGAVGALVRKNSLRDIAPGDFYVVFEH